MFKQQITPLLTRKGLLFISGGALAGLNYSLHFVIEFSSLAAVGLPPVFILFHLGAVPFGVLFYLLWSSKQNQNLNFVLSSTVLALSLVGLVLLKELPPSEFLVLLLLSLAGFSIGNYSPMIFLMISSFFTAPEYNGRLIFIGYIGLMLILVLMALIDLEGSLFSAIYIFSLLFIFLLTFLLGKSEPLFTKRVIPLNRYFQNGIFPFPVILLSFFIGFFTTNTYFSAYLIFYLDLTNIDLSFWNVFVVVLFLTCTLACLPSGFIFDKIGRRWSILIGFYFQVIAFITFFLIIIFPTFEIDFFVLVIFPAFSGIGLTLSLFGGLFTVIFELSPKGHDQVHSFVVFLVFSFGMILAVLLSSILEPLITTQPVLLPVLMLFLYFTATTAVFQSPEPLPSRAEQEWRQKLEHILILSSSGLLIYSESLGKPEKHKLRDAHAMIAGGILVSISAVINEITQASGLKMILQKDYAIMLEEGRYSIVAMLVTEELKTIRNKLQDFINDFEDFFEDLLADIDKKGRGVDAQVFTPARKLVAKYFG